MYKREKKMKTFTIELGGIGLVRLQDVARERGLSLEECVRLIFFLGLNDRYFDFLYKTEILRNLNKEEQK